MDVDINLVFKIIFGLVIIIQGILAYFIYELKRGKYYNPHPPGESNKCLENTKAIVALQTEMKTVIEDIKEIKSELKNR
jgi:hypothetical protein